MTNIIEYYAGVLDKLRLRCDFANPYNLIWIIPAQGEFSSVKKPISRMRFGVIDDIRRRHAASLTALL